MGKYLFKWSAKNGSSMDELGNVCTYGTGKFQNIQYGLSLNSNNSTAFKFNEALDSGDNNTNFEFTWGGCFIPRTKNYFHPVYFTSSKFPNCHIFGLFRIANNYFQQEVVDKDTNYVLHPIVMQEGFTNPSTNVNKIQYYIIRLRINYITLKGYLSINWNGKILNSIGVSYTGSISSRLHIDQFRFNPINNLCNHLGHFLYSGWMSDSDIKKQFLEWTSLRLQNKAITGFNYPKSSSKDSQNSGLIAWYDFKPKNGKLINIAPDNSANGNNARQYDGTINRCGFIAGSVLFNANSSIVFPSTRGLSPSRHTICFVGKKINISNEMLVLYGNSYCGFYNTNGFRYLVPSSWVDWTILDINKSLSNSYVIRRTNRNIELFINGRSYGIQSISNDLGFEFTSINHEYNSKYILSDLRIYDKALSDKEIKDYHNSFVSTPVLKEDFNYAVGSLNINNWKRINNAGNLDKSYIKELQKDDFPLKKGTKYLFADAANPMWKALNINGFNGTLEIYFYRDSATTGWGTILFNTIPSLNNNGIYGVTVNTSNQISTVGSGFTVTNFSGTFSPNKWTKLTIKKDNLQFKFYIDNQERLSITGNNNSKLNYLILRNVTGTFQFANLKIYPGITV